MGNSINQEVVLLEASAAFLPTSEMILDSIIRPEEISSVERYSSLSIIANYQKVSKVTDKTYMVHGSRQSKENLGVIEVESDRTRIRLKALVSNKREQGEKESALYLEMLENKINELVEEAKQQILESLHDIQTIQKELKIESKNSINSDLFID
ncbi:hypothetical protein EN12_24495 [Vibrio cholerae]|nr:hypothetical protein EN12_24495 [Vibrio cholerae]